MRNQFRFDLSRLKNLLYYENTHFKNLKIILLKPSYENDFLWNLQVSGIEIWSVQLWYCNKKAE